MMEPPHVIIYEQRPRLTPEMQRQFLDDNLRIHTCTNLRDIPSLVQASSQSLLLLDLDADPAGCLQLLGRYIGEMPLPIICVGSSASAELEWMVRELGALEFLVGPVSGELLANLCRRQWEDGIPA